jgi:ferredoxin
VADIFEKLRDKLDKMATGYPATESGVELRVLRQLFSEQDAELFLKMETNFETPLEVALRLGVDAGVIAVRLETMAKKGLLFRIRRGSELRYSAIPFIVGIYEFQVNNLTPALLKEFSEYYITALGKTFHGIKTPHQRTVPIETSVSAGRPVVPYEDAAGIIRSKKLIAIAECLCRKAMKVYGKQCRHPMETCMQFDSFAEYYVDNGMARYISTDEALAILKRNEQEGLVLQTLNSQKVEAICACCSCCCGMLIALKLFPAPALEAKSSYACQFEASLCTGCGTCVKRCPVGAYKLIEGKVQYKPARCIGCGLCVPFCPVHAHTLAKKPEEKIYTPPETYFTALEQMSKDR